MKSIQLFCLLAVTQMYPMNLSPDSQRSESTSETVLFTLESKMRRRHKNKSRKNRPSEYDLVGAHQTSKQGKGSLSFLVTFRKLFSCACCNKGEVEEQ